MIFDIYGALKEAYALYGKLNDKRKKNNSFSNAFRKAVEEYKTKEQAGVELSRQLTDPEHKTKMIKDMKKILDKAVAARELNDMLSQYLESETPSDHPKDISDFLALLFLNLLQTDQYAQKIVSMRFDIELSAIHEVAKDILAGIGSGEKKQRIPRILTRYTPKPQKWLIGREKDITAILNMTDTSRKIVIVNGMGGIGKTAICRALFYDQQISGQMAWINYKGKLLDDLVEQFYYPMFDNSLSFEEKKDRILIFLREDISENAFLFIDNLNTDEQFDSDLGLLDSFCCRIICTSRLRTIGTFTTYDLDFLNVEACIDMFECYYRKLRSLAERTIIREVVELAGFHTLTIEAIAKTSQQDRLSPKEILDKLKRKGFNLSEAVTQITHRDGTTKEATIIRHLKYVFDVSQLVDKEQQTILKALSILPNLTVPFDVHKWFNLVNRNQINYLVNYAWLNVTEDGYFMHHVIKEVIKESCRIRISDCKEMIEYFIHHLDNKGSTSVEEYDGILPYAEYVLDYFKDSDDKNIGILSRCVGTAYFYTGKYEEGLQKLQKAYEILSEQFPPNHKEVFSIFCAKASIENCLGHFGEAIRLYQEAVIRCKASEYQNTTIMADIYRDIATGYMDNNELEKSLLYANKATVIYQQNNAYEDLASTYNNIGLTYYYSGEERKALDYYQEAETLYQRRLPENHQDYATLYNNIAMVLCNNGELDKSLEYHLKALEIRNKFENGDHMDLSQSYNNIATVFAKMANYEKALEFQLLDIYILEGINKKHPYLKQSYKKLYDFYSAIDQQKKAAEYLRKSEEIE